MKPKTMILMGLAVVCGLGASYMTSRLLAERQPREEERVKILVAKRVISVGERISKPEEMFEVKEVTRDNEPPDAIKEFDALKGKILKTTRNRGDHVTAGNLYEKDTLEIPEGHMAVGLPVNLATTAHGLASLPGSRVDIILTVKAQDIRHTQAKVLVENVLVLAADGRTSREGEVIAPASVVTFALNKKDSLKVSAAKEMGILSLSLRKLNDVSSTPGMTVTGDQIMREIDSPRTFAEAGPQVDPKTEPKANTTAKVAPKVEDPRSSHHTMTIISGERIENRNYRRYENGDVEEFDFYTPPTRPQPKTAPKDLDF